MNTQERNAQERARLEAQSEGVKRGWDEEYAKEVRCVLSNHVDKPAERDLLLKLGDAVNSKDENERLTSLSEALPVVIEYCEKNSCSLSLYQDATFMIDFRDEKRFPIDTESHLVKDNLWEIGKFFRFDD